MTEPVKAPAERRQPSVPDTIISLIVAFVIAMTFRGFVLEGFVIPTGSMAPTLLGEHALWRSPQTGYVFSTDTGMRFARFGGNEDWIQLFDPMLGRTSAVASIPIQEFPPRTRPGDRVLVLKWLYSFIDPNRFDVIVFKNPEDSDENYIKRLVGLPGEEVWLADGDVFTRPKDRPDDSFEIRRKPDHVQRRVWQPVYDSRYVPIRPDQLHNYAPPWVGPGWDFDSDQRYRCETADPTVLHWDARRWPINDLNSYNMFAGGRHDLAVFPVSDVRVRAGIAPDRRGLRTTLRLIARTHEFEFILDDARGEATVRMRPAVTNRGLNSRGSIDQNGWTQSRSAAIAALEPGRVANVEFWHVDQSMAIYVDGDRVIDLNYEWDPYIRLRLATGRGVDEVLRTASAAHPWLEEALPSEASMEWAFAGSALSMHRVRVDRDLYYQPTTQMDEFTPGIGTHPQYTAKLGDDQYFMLGDNSPASKDSRKWGEPDRAVAEQIDPAPFVVNRRLIVGRAWCVYFPAPFALREGGRRFIPDFGRLRFIR